MRNFLPNQTVIFTLFGYDDEDKNALPATGKIKGIATTGAPVIGRSMIVEPFGPVLDYLRANGFQFDCIVIFESQIN